MPAVGAVPVLLTEIAYVPVAPIVKVPVCDFTIASTGLTIVVGSVAVGEFVAPPPLAVAVLVTSGTAAASTFTVSVIGLPVAAGSMLVALVHVTVCPAAVQVHPVPLAALNVKPLGRVSATVMFPAVGTLPELLTTIEYVPVCPVANDPVCDLAIASVGLPDSFVGSVALGALVAPPPLAVTEFVTDPGAPTALTVNVMGAAPAPAAMAVALVQVAL